MSEPTRSKSRPMDPRKARQNLVLALVHVLLALLILGGFVYTQMQG